MALQQNVSLPDSIRILPNGKKINKCSKDLMTRKFVISTLCRRMYDVTKTINLTIDKSHMAANPKIQLLPFEAVLVKKFRDTYLAALHFFHFVNLQDCWEVKIIFRVKNCHNAARCWQNHSIVEQCRSSRHGRPMPRRLCAGAEREERQVHDQKGRSL